jgi:hypothetical protein
VTDFNVPRDRWGRPKLYPPEGPERLGYSRPSTLGKDLDTGKFLLPWNEFMVVRGFLRRKYLLDRISSILARGGSWAKDKREIQKILEEAGEAGGIHEKADRGTSIHDLAWAIELGWPDWDLIPDEFHPALEWYGENVVPHMIVLERECFVAVDRKFYVPSGDPNHPTEIDFRAAGSIDRIAEIKVTNPWGLEPGRYIVDIKSGRDDEFRMGVCGQTYLYSVGRLYRDELISQEADWAVWEPSEVNPSSRACTHVNLDYALMFQSPQPGRGAAWKIHKIPLAKGREIIECGQWARKCRNVPEFERVL